MQKGIWDVVVIGGGPAGCNAAITLSRVRRKVLILDEGKQRNILSHGMHNYLTRDGILPTDYLLAAHEELAKYGVQIVKERAVKACKLAAHGFEVQDARGDIYLCRRLLLATGVTDIVPGIPGMRELWGCAVFHCPYCDGWECQDKTIGLYAKNVNGYGMALALRELSDNITLFTDGRRYLRSSQRLQLDARNINVISDPIKELAYTGNKLQAVILTNGTPAACEVMFVDNGYKSNDELLSQLNCSRSKKGAALTNKQQQTNIKGVYVAGDASFDMHFVIVAAAEGAKAAVAIHNDLLKLDNITVQEQDTVQQS